MIETLAKEIPKFQDKLKDLPSESNVKELGEIKIPINPLEYSLGTIENQSLESLKIENKVLFANKEVNETKSEQLEKNREDGKNREDAAHEELKKEYPESEGYKIEREQYLRDKDGNIVKDPVTGEARRIDFVVTKDGKVVKSVEVTSEKAPKEPQTEKEHRIREEGGNFIKDRDMGELIEFHKNVETEIRRYP